MASILDKWVELRGSGELTPEERKTLLAQVIAGGEKAPRLYRGADLGAVKESDLVPGRAIDFGPSSASEDEGSALPYAESSDNPVLFVLDGSKGLNVQDRAERVGGYAEAEWVTGGRHYVHGVERDEDGLLVVTVSPALGSDSVSQKNSGKAPIDLDASAPEPEPAKLDSKGRERVSVPASDVRVGDYLDDRTRISKVHANGGKVTAQTKVQGSSSPGLRQWSADEQVKVRRAPAEPDPASEPAPAKTTKGTLASRGIGAKQVGMRVRLTTSNGVVIEGRLTRNNEPGAPGGGGAFYILTDDNKLQDIPQSSQKAYTKAEILDSTKTPYGVRHTAATGPELTEPDAAAATSVPLDLIDPSDYKTWADAQGPFSQPAHQQRLKMAQDDLDRGDVRPLRVKKVGDRYQLIDGHHRYIAYRMAGYPNAPVEIEGDDSGTLPEGTTEDLAGPGDVGDPTPDLPGPVVGQSDPGDGGAGTKLPDHVAPFVGPGDKVYAHPQGSYIVAGPDGSVVKIGPDGKPRKTSATAAKLAVGHGSWTPVELSVPAPVKKPVEPPLEDKPIQDVPIEESVVVAAKPEPELPSAPAPKTASKHQVPMTFNEAPVTDVPKYIEDPDFHFQQKVDGIRGQLVVEPGKKPWFRSKSGDALVNSSAAKITGPLLAKLGAQSDYDGPAYTIDGELLDGKWYVFDVAVDGGEKVPWEDRMKTAEGWVAEMHKLGLKQIQALPVARTPEEKRKLWDAVLASGGEGVMMKRKDAPYNYGQRVNHTLKAKITSTADVVVMERNIDGKENARIGIHINGTLVSIGTVSMQGKEKGGAVNVGDVIEVEYLWANPANHNLQQPRVVKRRPDKKPADATADQLRFVSKDVVDVEAGKAPDPAPAPESPAPAPEAAKAPASGLDGVLPDGWSIEGDPASGSFTLNRGDKNPPMGVTKSERGTWVYSGGYALSAWQPKLWRAIRGDDPPSYGDLSGLDDVALQSKLNLMPSDQKADLSADYGVAQLPAYSVHWNGKEKQDFYSNVGYAWQQDIRAAIKRGGPERHETGIADPATASTPDLEAALDSLNARSIEASHDDAATTDKAGTGGTLLPSDHYKADRSRKRVAAIAEAAAPLREEMLRRLREEHPGGEADYDADRWDAARSTPVYTDTNPALKGAVDEDALRAIRDTYVVKDKNTVDKNADLRSASPSSAAKTWRGKTDRWIRASVAENDTIVYRGIAVPASFVRQLQPGATITDPGVMSTADTPGEALGYLGIRVKTRPSSVPVLLEILTPAGHPIADADFGEYVLPSNTSMVVRKVSVDGDGTYKVSVELGASGGDGGGPGGVTASASGLTVRQARVEGLRRIVHGALTSGS